MSKAHRCDCIGIDLGTTNSVVAFMNDGVPTVIPNKEGNRLTPSVVAFKGSGEILVGDVARRQVVNNPQRTIYSIKQFMGRRRDEVDTESMLVPYEIVGGPNEFVKVRVDGREFTPSAISAMVIRSLKESAESYLGHKVHKAVVTVPAYFNDAQRQATRDAGRIAGLEVVRIVNEPTAAALLYGLDKKKDERIVVFDLGGGTFDVSVLHVSSDGVFQVVSTNGDTHLGGDDFDQVLMDHVADRFRREQGVDLLADAITVQRLRDACEYAKKVLSIAQSSDINLPFIAVDASGPKHLQMTITRTQFEHLCDGLVARCRGPMVQALEDAKLDPEEIDDVVLVGGCTRIPKIQEFVSKFFSRELQQRVDPDEVVAMGAAIQGGVLGGDVPEVLLLDVTPLSLGIETEGGIFTKLVEKNTTIPNERKRLFTTTRDDQAEVTVSVYQGERPIARDNRLLGQFSLEGIPAAARGKPQIEVRFAIDANGILHVDAKDLGTGNLQKIRIDQASGLSESEIERMRKDAQSQAEEDERKLRLAEVRTKAELLCFRAEMLLKENNTRFFAFDKAPLEIAIVKTREMLRAENIAAIQAAHAALEQATNAISRSRFEATLTHRWKEWRASKANGLTPVRKLFFDHIPKCAGTSVRIFLQRLYPRKKTFGVYSGIETQCQRFKSMPESLRHDFDLVIGHGVHTLIDYVAAQAVTATVLRQPVDRIISHYHYVLREPNHYLHEKVVRGRMSLRDYVESGLSDELYNFMTCHYLGVSPAEAEQDANLSVERAVEIIRTRYRVVGVVERLPAFMTAVCKEIGTAARWDNTRVNVTDSRPRTESITAEDYQMIAARNSLDMRLYERITEIAIGDPGPLPKS